MVQHLRLLKYNSYIENWIQNLCILGVHGLAMYALFLNPTTTSIVFCFLLAYVRIFLVAAGIHRYFSHKAFHLNRIYQFILAFLCTLCLQNSVFWWVARHRQHHINTDTDLDPHCPKKGFFWSYIGWMMSDNGVFDKKIISDLNKFPELVFLDKNYKVINLVFISGFALFSGLEYFVWLYCLPTVICWHSFFLINTFCHGHGYRNFNTKENSSNVFLLGFFCLGEGFHNNHHQSPSRLNNRVKWYEIDLTYCVLYVLDKIKIAKIKK